MKKINLSNWKKYSKYISISISIAVILMWCDTYLSSKKVKEYYSCINTNNIEKIERFIELGKHISFPFIKSVEDENQKVIKLKWFTGSTDIYDNKEMTENFKIPTLLTFHISDKKDIKDNMKILIYENGKPTKVIYNQESIEISEDIDYKIYAVGKDFSGKIKIIKTY